VTDSKREREGREREVWFSRGEERGQTITSNVVVRIVSLYLIW
jgi:hypothetical protein